ncbi:Ig-like domain-containing protein [Candidatus Nitrosopumilus sediminis]|uniref:Ig-like domain-containing protein n=1 Tax=Candidatus Nitrosopumilus sediminis TaxID=1229909 RepID=UPI00064F28C8|nr:Ig-like domain-containing protein [Candidatus Nitrosopumilus sediminis]
MNLKLFAIFLIFLLPMFSIPSYADIVSESIVSESIVSESIVSESIVSESIVSESIISESKHRKINLVENLGISDYKPYKISNNSIRTILLHESISILSDQKYISDFAIIKPSYDKYTITERIFERNKIQNNFVSSNSESITLNLLSDSKHNEIINDDLNFLNTSILEFISNIWKLSAINSENNFVSSSNHLLFNQNINTDSSDNSIVILLLIIPLTGYLLLKSENEKIKIFSRQTLSSFSIILLLSAAFLTPFSISESYWGSAYAEEFSFNGLIDDSIKINLEPNISLSESISLSDTLTRDTQRDLTRSLTESISITDSVNITKLLIMKTSEIISDTTINVTFNQNLNAATVSVSDFTILSPLGKTVTAVSVSGNVVTLTISPPLGASEAATIQLSSGVSSTLGQVALTPQTSTDPDGDSVVVAPKITLIATKNIPYTVTGTSESNSSIEIYDGATLKGTGIANNTGSWTVSISGLSDGTHSITAKQTDTSGNFATSSGYTVIVSSTNPNTLVNTTPDTVTVPVQTSNTQIILFPTSNVSTITIPRTATQNIILDYSQLGGPVNQVTIPQKETITFFSPHQHEDNVLEDDAGIIVIADGTIITGPGTWNKLVTINPSSTVSLPDETSQSGSTITTVSYSETAVFSVGLDSGSLQLSKPARIEFTNDALPGFVPFFVDSSGTITFVYALPGFVPFFVDSSGTITFVSVTCASDDLATALPAGIHECFIVIGDDIVVYTDHFTKFGVSKKSTSHSSVTGGAGTGGSGRTGVGPGAAGTSRVGGFGGLLDTPLTINEVSYDKCNENMARILVSSDADTPPTVKISTAKSGVVYATLAQVQPYEDINKFSTIDKYLYELPISSDESFLMISVTEEKGTTNNTVQSSIKLLSCEGTSVFVPLPEYELPKASEYAPRIFDAKVQIANGTTYDAKTESKFLYVDGQDLRVSAIIDSDTLLKRVELRSIAMGQSDDQYISVVMDVESLYVSDSISLVSGSIPSFLMVEPGMIYWLHITDENDNVSESAHYNIGVKPSQVSDVEVEVDMPTIRPSGSTIKPEFYIFNEDSPSYGIVSLVINGQVVSKKSQLFGTGQTHVVFNWNIPKSDSYVTYDFEGKVDLYDNAIITESALVSSHPKTISVVASDMPALKVISQDEQVLADPALVYASDDNTELRFKVTDPQGQCIIGASTECLIKDSTFGKRGGLESIPYGEQILRVKYSGADNILERFSITSVDPIIGQWNVSLVADDGFVQEAHASEDPIVKIKYRYHSKTITVKSN